MDPETLRLIVATTGALLSGLIGALVSGWLTRRTTLKTLAATAQLSADEAARARDYEHERWLRDAKRDAYEAFLTAMNTLLATWDTEHGRRGDRRDLRDARSRLRVVGAVTVRKRAAAIVAEYASLIARAEVRGLDRRDPETATIRRALEVQLDAYVREVRIDLSTATDEDDQLGAVAFDTGDSDVDVAALRTFTSYGGGGGDEEE